MRITHSAARLAVVGLAGATIAGLGVAAASAKGGDASKVSYVPGACSYGTAAMGILTQSGHRAQIAWGASSEGAFGDWHVVVTGNGDAGFTPLFDIDTGAVGTAWTVVQNVELPKGRNTISVLATNNNGETCTGEFFTKV